MLWDRQHPRMFQHDEVAYDPEAFRAELLTTAAEEEEAYLPWADRIAAVRRMGTSDATSGKQRFMRLRPDTAPSQADDLFEGLGWFSLFDASTSALTEMDDLVFRPAPSVPAHWAEADSVHDPDDVDEIWGSVSALAPWTRLAIAALRPASRAGLLKLVEDNAGGSNLFSYGALATAQEWYGLSPLPQNVAGLVALSGVAGGDVAHIEDAFTQRIAQLHHAIESADKTRDALEAQTIRGGV